MTASAVSFFGDSERSVSWGGSSRPDRSSLGSDCSTSREYSFRPDPDFFGLDGSASRDESLRPDRLFCSSGAGEGVGVGRISVRRGRFKPCRGARDTESEPSKLRSLGNTPGPLMGLVMYSAGSMM